MSRLSKLFRSRTRPVARTARLGVEALDARLITSDTFTEHPDHTVDVVATAHQNNTITIRNDGDGNLAITADGVTRNFTQVVNVNVETGDGRDTVTYNQGTSTHRVDLRRSFGLSVDFQGGFFDDGQGDHFTANVFGDVGFSQIGIVHARELGFDVLGGNGADRIDFNFHDTDVRAGSKLSVFAMGFGGNDNITLDSDGEVDGDFSFSLQGTDDNDTVAANVLLDSGSTGSVGGRFANVRGDNGSDAVTLAVRQQTGSHASVNAVVDGGLSLFDHDVGRHTANVRAAFLEQDIVIA
jgi:hypothetical protein